MSKDEYLITDAPLKALTVFAMPMILGSFFQQVYNMADSIIVGQFVGSSALAAVGACAALTNVFICVALGAGVGAGVLVSRYFGAKEYGKMKTIVSTSLISFLLLSILLGIFGFCFSHAILSRLHSTKRDLTQSRIWRFIGSLWILGTEQEHVYRMWTYPKTFGHIKTQHPFWIDLKWWLVTCRMRKQ